MHYMSVKPTKRMTTVVSEVNEYCHTITISSKSYTRCVFLVPVIRGGISPTRKYLAEVRWHERDDETESQNLIQILDPVLVASLETIIVKTITSPSLLKGNVLDTSDGYKALMPYPRSAKYKGSVAVVPIVPVDDDEENH